MAYHAFRHHTFQPETGLSPTILCQILSATDKLCQIATGRTTSRWLGPADSRSGSLPKGAAKPVLPKGFYCYYYSCVLEADS
jgi:hypothetical protein